MQHTASDSNTPPPIDPFKSDLLTDAQVGRLLGVSPFSVWRYRTKGKRGVKLPAVPFGRKYVTSPECVRWFVAQLQQAEQPQRQPRRREIDPELAAACEAAGI